MPTKNASTASTWTDPDDAPPLDEAWFAEADLVDAGRLVRKGGSSVDDAEEGRSA